MKENMTSKERVMNALNGLPVDRTPVSNPTSVATVELMDLVEAPFPEANRDPELNARLAATGYTELGFDSIMPVFSIIQESSALGCEIQWEVKDNWPTVRMYKPIWDEPEDIHLPKTFWEHQDIKVVLKSHIFNPCLSLLVGTFLNFNGSAGPTGFNQLDCILWLQFIKT